MFKIRPKSLFGFLFGCFIIISWSWLHYKFDISPQRLLLFTFIAFIVIGVFLSSSLFERLIHVIFDSFSEEKKKEKFQTQIKKLSVPEEKKKLILEWSKKINFELYELRSLIKYHGIEDDEFWISIFLSNVKEIPNNNRDYFYGFLVQLKSKESQNRLKNILISRGILTEDKKAETMEMMLFRSLRK